jgi:hypothetical protein
MFQVLFAAGISLFQWVLPRLMAIAGVATVSAAVYTPMLNLLQNKITASFTGLSAEALGFIQFVGIPNAISIIFAGITVQIGIKAAKAAFAKKGATNDV